MYNPYNIRLDMLCLSGTNWCGVAEGKLCNQFGFGERKLSFAKIMQHLVDLKSKAENRRARLNRKRAKEFFFEDDEYLGYFCDVADLKMQRVRQYAQRVMDALQMDASSNKISSINDYIKGNSNGKATRGKKITEVNKLITWPRMGN